MKYGKTTISIRLTDAKDSCGLILNVANFITPKSAFVSCLKLISDGFDVILAQNAFSS
ncbi:MAG: hypothetical protein V1897_19305 [Pseudomonadota bacterium]